MPRLPDRRTGYVHRWCEWREERGDGTYEEVGGRGGAGCDEVEEGRASSWHDGCGYGGEDGG